MLQGDRSVGTYNPQTKGKFNFSDTATSTEKTAFSDPKVLEAVKNASIQTATKGNNRRVKHHKSTTTSTTI
jgi:hypothetical protein